MIFMILYLVMVAFTAGYFAVMENQDELSILIGAVWPISWSACFGVIVARLVRKRLERKDGEG